MGIRRLTSFLHKHYSHVFCKMKSNHFYGKKIAVDTSIYIFKYKSLHGSNWLFAFINLLLFLRNNNIHPVFVFDVGYPPEKRYEKSKRSKRREDIKQKLILLEKELERYLKDGDINLMLYNRYRLSHSHHHHHHNIVEESGLNSSSTLKLEKYDDILRRKIFALKSSIVTVVPEDFIRTKEVLDLLGIPRYDAILEAETICSDFCKKGLVDAVLSEDSDVLAYGANQVIFEIDVDKNKFLVLKYNTLLRELKLSPDQFLDFCLLCGCDYVGSSFREPLDALQYIHDNKGLEKHTNYEHLNKIRALYKEYCSLDVNYIPFCEPVVLDKIKAVYDFYDKQKN